MGSLAMGAVSPPFASSLSLLVMKVSITNEWERRLRRPDAHEYI